MKSKSQDITKRFKITVCADGFVSVVEDMKDRRLKAALACYSVDDIGMAMELVRRTTILGRCGHGKKIGTTIEPKAKNWPRFDGSPQSPDLEYLYEFGRILKEEEDKLNATDISVSNSPFK